MPNYKRYFLHGHSYFLTVVTHQRQNILIDYIDILRESFRESKQFYTYTINEIVILPDHFHLIITPQNVMEYPKIIKAIKYNFTRRYENQTIEQSHSRYKKKMKAIWQKRYYEHTIRDEEDYQRCVEYIYLNPIKHQYVKNITEWQYSSYYKRNM